MLRFLLDGNDSTRSRQFALTNALKCVGHTGRARTKPSQTMVESCRRHVFAEIGRLAPQMIIAQGEHPGSSVKRIFPSLSRVGDVHHEKGKGYAEVLGDADRVVVTTPHPASRHLDLKWKQGPLPQFLIEALGVAKREALSLQR